MATLAAIQKQIADLERQAEAIRKSEAKAAAEKVRQLIARHNLSPEDIGLAGQAAKKATATVAVGGAKRKLVTPKPAGIPKYRDPKSGKTWTGTGKAPGWIAGAKSRDKFLIAPLSAVATVSKAVVPTKTPASNPLAGKQANAVTAAAPKKRAAVLAPTAPAKKSAVLKPTAKQGAAKVALSAKPEAIETTPVVPNETSGS